MAGGVFTGANPTYVARELAYQLQDSGAKFLITAETSLDTALDAAASIGFPRENVLAFDDGFATLAGRNTDFRGVRPWSSLLASEAEGQGFAWETFTTREQMHATCVLNYSSGTTGVPKGVEITHLNYVANCQQTEFVAALDPDYTALLQRARGLSFLPMYHAYGQTVHCVSLPMKSIPIYVMRKFDFQRMLEYIERYRITSLNLVPPIVVAVAKSPLVKNYDLSSVESTGCGAAPLGREPTVDYEKVFKNKFQLRQGWGMTELTCSAMGWDPTWSADSSAVGELNPNMEGLIVDEKGTSVKVGERGELMIRGPNVMKGYWKKPDATKETMTADGWLKTGDIAYREDNGLIHIVDRTYHQRGDVMSTSPPPRL